ncbi:MAG TPA: hypothetical protein VI895_08305 [Bdellovibrionota bacterium]|nr:hypothetical protein [Bdellovibrionota bacterium]
MVIFVLSAGLFFVPPYSSRAADECPPKLLEALRQLFEVDPNDRAAIEEILNGPLAEALANTPPGPNSARANEIGHLMRDENPGSSQAAQNLAKHHFPETLPSSVAPGRDAPIQIVKGMKVPVILDTGEVTVGEVFDFDFAGTVMVEYTQGNLRVFPHVDKSRIEQMLKTAQAESKGILGKEGFMVSEGALIKLFGTFEQKVNYAFRMYNASFRGIKKGHIVVQVQQNGLVRHGNAIKVSHSQVEVRWEDGTKSMLSTASAEEAKKEWIRGCLDEVQEIINEASNSSSPIHFVDFEGIQVPVVGDTSSPELKAIMNMADRRLRESAGEVAVDTTIAATKIETRYIHALETYWAKIVDGGNEKAKRDFLKLLKEIQNSSEFKSLPKEYGLYGTTGKNKIYVNRRVLLALAHKLAEKRLISRWD